MPRLAGRQAADIVAQMQAFKTGQKTSTVMDRIALLAASLASSAAQEGLKPFDVVGDAIPTSRAGRATPNAVA